MSISSSAMLVELNISVWTASVTDRKATDKVTYDASASQDAGLFKKNLMAGTTLRKEIADYAALCRTWHNGRTMPWSDRGPRLLPTSMFFDYKTEANARRDYFNNKRDKFVAEYPQLLADAPQHLGALFNPADYPTVEEVASKFDFRLVFTPLPDAGDFRLDLPKQELEEMRQQYDAAYGARVNDAMQSAWDRLHEALTHMGEKLTDPDGDDAPKRQFRDTFVSNLSELCSLLTHLNITKDPKLELARRDLEKMVANVDIDDIRKDAGCRADLKAQVEATLSRYDW